MAKMFPKLFPKDYEKNKPASEKKLYDALSGLSNDYRVFYNTTWQQKNDGRPPKEGESDFIVAHPEKGIIVIEVKGGEIRYDPDYDKWTSTDFYGKTNDIKNPIQQAASTKRWLTDELKKIQSFKPRWINIWQAVCFPDTEIPQGSYVTTDIDRRQVIDRDDLKNIKTIIDKIFTIFIETQGDEKLGYNGIEILEKLLGSQRIFKSPLKLHLKDENEALIELTYDQLSIFSILGSRKRTAISGCAGSGKTMIGVLRAKQLADLGHNVLFLCFNNKLATYLTPLMENCKVSTFHKLCDEAAVKLGVNLSSFIRDDDYFTNISPNILAEYAEKTKTKFDAIIVDEAQDFHDNYWIAIEALLKENSYLHIFFDDNQNIFYGDTTFQGLIDEKPFELHENCRNTKSIHHHVKVFHSNPSIIKSNAPQGRPPNWKSYFTVEELKNGLRKELHRLHNEGGVSLDDIVILTPKSMKNSVLKEKLKLGNFELSWSQKKGAMFVSTIQSFKGLERLVVIIAEIDREDRLTEMHLYTGCSRALTELTCFYHEELDKFIYKKGLIED